MIHEYVANVKIFNLFLVIFSSIKFIRMKTHAQGIDNIRHSHMKHISALSEIIDTYC